MYRCFYYWLFAPLRGGIEDSPDRISAFTIAVNDIDKTTYELSLFCDKVGEPEFARLIIPNLITEQLPHGLLPLLQSIQEHMLSVLRLTYRPDAMLARPTAVWSFIADDKPPVVKVAIQEMRSNVHDPEKTRTVFIHTFEIRELLRLFVDGSDDRIPLQYRYLSLYKMLESRFRKLGRWDGRGLEGLLHPHVESLLKLGLNAKSTSILHDLRDGCAHIRTGRGGRREVLGVTHLNPKELVRVESMLPYLRSMCAHILNERLEGKVAFSTEVVVSAVKPARE